MLVVQLGPIKASNLQVTITVFLNGLTLVVLTVAWLLVTPDRTKELYTRLARAERQTEMKRGQ